ncbi:hypothetical protein J1N35_007983 [Gossypium stocksii]|uniref:Uncharacterized protein n=1 Tax=Gossypium stocksii TaxID=47602 RepID=A0A9D3W9G2_9ROSI|nr:hypothetical protein J1N35_007983 [Gossypium stocksii]
MSRLIYKFPVSSNIIKFTKMKLIDDEDIETMIVLYCSIRNVNTKPVWLFVELTDVKPVLNVTLLSKKYSVEDPCTKVLRASVDKRSSVYEFDFDLNVGWAKQCSYGETSTWAENPHHDLTTYKNPNPGYHAAPG